MKRTATHQFFKKHYPGRVTTETHEGAIKIRMFMMKDARGMLFSVCDPSALICAQNGNSHPKAIIPFRQNSTDRRNRRPDSFEALGGLYCEFCLFKENRDTMEVINMISQLLK